MQMSGFSVGLGLAADAGRPFVAPGGGQGPVITATTAPVMLALDDTGTPADGYVAGSYVSSAGTIVSETVTYLVDGVAQPGTHALSAGQSVQASVLVTDSASNSATFTTATVIVSAASPSASLSLVTTRGNDRVAPEAICFEAQPSGFAVAGPAPGEIYSPRDHQIFYSWSFSDAGSYGAPVNLVAGQNNRNLAYGRKVWHCFTQPGTYQVRCVATDRSGNSASVTTSVTVGDGATAWPGTQTLVVALDGNFAGAPAGAGQYSSLSAALTAYQNLAGKGRVLLKRGETHTITSAINVTTAHGNFHMGAWGSGAKPVLNNTVGGVNCFVLKAGYANDFTLSNLDIRGGWDATTETGLEGQWGVFNYNATGAITISECDFSGLDTAIYPHATTGLFCVNDCSITNWENYGIFAGKAQSANAGILGSRIAQHVDALAGSTTKTQPGNWHGPLRHAFKSLYMDGCDLFSINGWSTNPGVVFAAQPCIRHNTKVTPDCYAYYTRLVCEGGWKIISMQDSEGTVNDLAGNVIFDGLYLLGTAGTDYGFYIQYGGTTIRNCALVRPDVPALVNGFKAMVHLAPDGLDAVNNASPIDIYNNTFVDLRGPANDTNNPFQMLVNAGGHFTSITTDNNISHAPNLPAPVTGDAPLDTAPALVPRYKGFRWSGNPVLDTAYATPPSSAAQYRPLAGSAAIGGAVSGQIAHVDFFGAVRATPSSRGAIDAG